MPQGLGEFEQMVLLAILHAKGEAYGVPIVEEIERRTGRTVSRAAVYVTLRRLEKRGLVTSWMGEPTGDRGGKAKRHFEVRPEGVQALEASRAVREQQQKYDDFVRRIDTGEVGDLELEPSENVRSVKVRLRRASSRVGIDLDIWDANGQVYFRRLTRRGRPRSARPCPASGDRGWGWEAA